MLSLKRMQASAHNLLKSKLRRVLESQRTKGTAVRELRLREKVHPTAANMNLTKLYLLIKKGGSVVCCAATNISAKVMPLHNKLSK